MAIGATLKDARRRLGMDVKEAEERTKIRARYLRALEAEDWEILPAPAYVRGFLRAYGQILGLDGGMLADEFRRRHETAPTPNAAAEPVLKDRPRSPGGSRPPAGNPLLIGLGIAVVLVLLIFGIIGLLGGDDDPEGEPPDRKGDRARAERMLERRGGGSSSLERIDLRIEPLSAAQVCVVGGGRDTLLDNQLLSAGAEEEFGDQRSFRVDIEAGTVDLKAGSESREITASRPVSLEIDSNGIREIDFVADCP